MFKIHTSDGQTVRIDLSSEEEAREWLPRLQRDDFQATITGISLIENHELAVRCLACGSKTVGKYGVQYSVTRPRGFRKLSFHTEDVQPDGRIRGGDRVILWSDDTQLTLMAHRSQPSARVTLTKTGQQKYNPFMDRER